MTRNFQLLLLVGWLLTGIAAGESLPDPAANAGRDETTDSVPAPTELPAGALLFSRGDCLAVKVFTGSPYTHVAIVCRAGAALCVYDACPGVGVRQQPLAEYLQTIAPDRVQVVVPCRPLSETEERRLQGYLDESVGTPYSVLHHATGKRARGVHCAELTTDALMAIEWLQAESPPRVSPGSLLTGLVEGGVYERGPEMVLEKVVPPAQQATSRCGQLWLETCDCCRSCCQKLSRIFLCR
jgi:hypothetical protein